MKIYHFSLLFAIFFISVIIIKDSEMNMKNHENGMAEKDEFALERAVEAAMWELRTAELGFDDKKGLKAIDAFLYSLYASKNIIDDMVKRDEIKSSFRMFVISLKSGYYVFTGDWSENGIEYRFTGSEMIPYDFEQAGVKTSFAYLYDTDMDEGRLVLKSYGATVADNELYIVDEDGIYHMDGCSDMGKARCVMFSQDGCVKLGARPCKRCIDK